MSDSHKLAPVFAWALAITLSIAHRAHAQCTPACPGDCNCDGTPDSAFLMGPQPDSFVLQLTTTSSGALFPVAQNDAFGNGSEQAFINDSNRVTTVEIVTGPQHGFSGMFHLPPQLPFAGVTLQTFFSNSSDYGGIIDFIRYRLWDQCCNTSSTVPAVYSVRFPVGNQVLGLSGTNWVRVADAPALDFTTAMSVDCWFRINALGTDANLVSKWGDAGVNDRSFSVGVLADGRIQFGLSRSDTQLDNTYHAFAGGAVLPQVWHHVTCTFDNVRRRIYLDGVLMADRASAGPMHQGTTDLAIGAHLRNNAAGPGQIGSLFPGRIERVRLWNRSLGQGEIRRIASRKEFNGFGSPPYLGATAYFEFDGSNASSTGAFTVTNVGTPTFPIDDTQPVLHFDCNGDGLPDVPGPSNDVNANGILDACENYESFCFGDGFGTPCPCNNKGGPGRGCANSANPQGALLRGSGVARVSADTFVLTASGLPGTASTLFLQYDAVLDGGLGAAFGDGLRCLSGNLIRLGTRTAAAGSAAYPSAGSPTVSVRGLVPPGSVRFYQAWYRNAATFCTSETFNLTNAIRVDWLP